MTWRALPLAAALSLVACGVDFAAWEAPTGDASDAAADGVPDPGEPEPGPAPEPEGEHESGRELQPEPDAEADADTETGPEADASLELPPLPTCPAGQASPLDVGGCEPAGIRGCAELFLDPETGACRPRRSHCPGSQVLDLQAGCVPVGPSPCVPELQDAQGFCRAKGDACGGSQTIVPSLGCVDVGPMQCDPMHQDADGLCVLSACPEGEIASPATGCVAVWSACASGWPSPGSGQTLYVDASGAPGGTGTMRDPFDSLSAAVDAAEAGATILLDDGEYPVNLVLAASDGLTLRGRCASKVTLRSASPDPGAPIVRVTGAGAAPKTTLLQDLRLADSAVGVLVEVGEGKLERVHVAQSVGVGLRTAPESDTDGTVYSSLLQSGLGIEALGGEALVVNTRFEADQHALVVAGEGSVTIAGGSIHASGSTAALRVEDGGYLLAADLVVRAPHALHVSGAASNAGLSRTVLLPPAAGALPASGLILAEAGGIVTLDFCALVQGPRYGIIARSGAFLSATHLLVRDTQPLPEGEAPAAGYGVHLGQGALAVLASTTIVGSTEAGVWVEDAKLGLTDSVVADTAPGLSGQTLAGFAIRAVDATVELEDVVLRGQDYGVWATDTSTEVLDPPFITAAQTLIGDAPEGSGGAGIYAGPAVKASVDDSVVIGAGESAVRISGATVDLARTLVMSTTGIPGYGVRAEDAALVTLSGSAIVDTAWSGVWASDLDTEVSLGGNLIEGTRPQGVALGRGAHAREGATLILAGDALVDNHDAGVSGDSEATIDARWIVVDGTSPAGAASVGGFGALIVGGAQLSALGALILDSRTAGIRIAGSGSQATVEGSAISGVAAPESGPQWAPGVSAQPGTRLVASGLRVESALGAAILLRQAEASLARTQLVTSQLAPVCGEGVADGLVAFGAEGLVLHGIESSAHPRAGLLLSGASGVGADLSVSGNAVGLALQNESVVELTDVSYETNDEDLKVDGGLCLPSTAVLDPL